MTNFKYIFHFLSESLQASSSAVVNPLQNIIQKILALVIKIFAGLILTSVIVFSLIVIGQEVNVMLLTFESGMALSLFVFSIVTFICGSFLVYLFKPQAKQQNENLYGLNLQNMILNFLEGLAEGIEKAAEGNKKEAELEKNI